MRFVHADKVRIPKGLSEYGITTAEVEQMFLEFCDKYQN